MSNIANTIISQLGRSAFVLMGTNKIVKTENGILFDVGNSTLKVRWVEVELDRTFDLYNVKVSNNRHREIGSTVGIYADMLHDVIERVTGLYTTLHPRR